MTGITDVRGKATSDPCRSYVLEAGLSLQLLKEIRGYVPIQIKQKSLKSFLKSSSASQLGLRGTMWPTEANLLCFYRSHSPKSVIILLALQMERLNHAETTYRKSCPVEIVSCTQCSPGDHTPLLEPGAAGSAGNCSASG